VDKLSVLENYVETDDFINMAGCKMNLPFDAGQAIIQLTIWDIFVYT